MWKCPKCGREYFSNACPSCGYTRGGRESATITSTERATTRRPSQPVKSVKKRKTWLWVLGWICIFPLPLTILLIRNQKMSKLVKYGLIAVAWLFYLLIAFGSNSDSSTSDTSATDINGTRTTVSATDNNIKSLKFSHNDSMTVKVGETKAAGGYLSVNAKHSKDLTPEDVVFVSENPEIAIITLKDKALNSFYYCNVTGVGTGETRVYATSKDGSIVSDYITVTVPQPTRIESIEIQNVKTDLAIGEKTTPSVTISPYNAEESLTWSSSNESVAVVDSKGASTAVGGGTTTITASSPNGITASYTINVDGSKHLMNLRITNIQQNDVNIGNEWSYINEVNGERIYIYDTIGLASGQNLTLHTRISEDDDNPDIGENTTWYTVSDGDIINGFTVTMDVYVTENGGKNSGKSAYYVVSYIFTPVN